MIRGMLATLLVVLGAYGTFIGALYVFQRGMMYVPGRERPSPAASGLPEMAPVEVRTDDGLVLTGWHRPAPPGRATLVYFHGNAGNIGDRGPKVRPYLDAGMGVLLAGYRGYGGNPGQPTEQGLYADARAWLRHLGGAGVGAGSIVLYGESLGTGVAVQMAHEGARAGRAVAALILEAPFSSMGAAAQIHYPYVPARWLVRDRYDSLSKIADVAAPVFVFHGAADEVVPIRLGRRLFEAARDPKESLWLPRANHNDLYDHGAAQAALSFLSRYVRN